MAILYTGIEMLSLIHISYTPQHSGNASTTIETPWINVGYSLTGVSERYYMAQNIPVNKIDGYVEPVSYTHLH